MRAINYVLALLLLPALGKAQFGDSVKAQLVKDWVRAKAYTLEYLTAMPGERYAFRPQDSVRNFAQQMIHLSQANVSLMNAATGSPIPPVINRTGLEQTAGAWSRDSVLYFVGLSYDYAIEAIKGFDLATAFERVARGRLNESRFGWALKAYEHQVHHRGQTAIYLRLAGRQPPFEKLFN